MASLSELEQINSIENLLNLVQKNRKVSLTNVKGGLQGFIANQLFDKAKKEQLDVLYIAPTENQAREKYRILRRFIDDIVYFPAEESHFYFSEAYSLYDLQERDTALKIALEKKPIFAVCSFESLLKKLPSPETFSSNSLTLKKMDEVDFNTLINQLTDFGYERSDITENVGQFSVRGEIIDVFPLSETRPLRIDFWDTEIESISYFDSASQRSEEEIDELTLTPLSENWLNAEDREKLLQKVLKKYGKQEIYGERLDTVSENSTLSNGILFAFSNNNNTLMDYLKLGSGKDPIIIWSSPDDSTDEAVEYFERIEAEYKMLASEGEAFPDEIKRYFTINQLVTRINQYPLVKLYLFSTTSRAEEIIDMDSRVIESFAGQPRILAEFLQNRSNDNYYIHFFAKNETGATRFRNYLKEFNLKEVDENDLKSPGIRISQGEITEGFELAQDKLVFLNESDFFKETKRKRRKRKDTNRIESFTDLKVGSLVVHDDYGIGRYQGLEQMEFGDSIKDMMVLEYAGDDRLYIPVESMDLVQVYVGTGESQEPKLNEIGTSQWNRAKQKARKVAEDMADELIKLYSKRENTEGYAFSPDTVWQQQFEDAFPFEETDDQLQSIEEIKQDMEKPVAMDRLLCGDVGYGKTEVAFRAAFKAAMEGKQVAFLVPTTVLAEQHYETAIERFKDFPINIKVLSRFNSAKEQKKIIQDVKDGNVDILIGTHRILSKDLKFKDLGLLIIDEEQRFGVRAKEKLKQMKENVDVLTLSATPIPRTLHMSLSGVRDMSVLEEPPLGRRPVQTYVLNYSKNIIREAIEREMRRNGQIFYIHNRVHDIDRVTEDIQDLVPQARVINAHGQMSGKELENVMHRFLNKEYDVLVATTIIENGIDASNVNTMIVENGDQFGLSQLYQLRGRVGRSDKQAYTYITHKNKKLSEDAKKRLKALRDFTAFGSGFKIAMRDLEIRGAGNILGSQQSGHMAKIGYELYTRILQQAITKKLTGKEVKKQEEAKITTDVTAYIPSSYIVGEDVRFDIYKKIANLRTWYDNRELEDELKDRFGKVPNSVKNLMLISMIKNVATSLDISQVIQNKQDVSIIFNSPEAEKEFKNYYLHMVVPLNRLRDKIKRQGKPTWSFVLKDKKELEQLVEIYDFLSKMRESKDRLENDLKGEQS